MPQNSAKGELRQLTPEQEQELLVLLKAGDQESAIELYRWKIFPGTTDRTASAAIRKIQLQNGLPRPWRKEDKWTVLVFSSLIILAAVLMTIEMFMRPGGLAGNWYQEDTLGHVGTIALTILKYAAMLTAGFGGLVLLMFAVKPLGQELISELISKFLINAITLLVLVVLLRSCLFYIGTPSATRVVIPKTGARFNPLDGLNYLFIPSGGFSMGCSVGDSACDPYESPRHEVHITGGVLARPNRSHASGLEEGDEHRSERVQR